MEVPLLGQCLLGLRERPPTLLDLFPFPNSTDSFGHPDLLEVLSGLNSNLSLLNFFDTVVLQKKQNWVFPVKNSLLDQCGQSLLPESELMEVLEDAGLGHTPLFLEAPFHNLSCDEQASPFWKEIWCAILKDYWVVREVLVAFLATSV